MERRQEERIENIRFLAKVYGWQEVQYDSLSYLLGFKRKGVRLQIWYNKMTIGTALNHPIKGKTQLFRRNVSISMLERIMDYPRLHTKKGYMKK